MEYIKKEELIKGEIYKANNSSLTYIMKATKDLKNVKNIPEYCDFMKHGCFNSSYLTFTNATSEEKHWLNTCIEQDKFITFEEAMKTFIPEYVELLNNGCRINNNISSGKIYKCSKDVTKTYHYGFLLDNKHRVGFNENEFDRYLKPSTKEAYDAQFVVKEPEFVLPEKWGIKFNNNWDILSKFKPFNNKYIGNAGSTSFYKYNLFNQKTDCDFKLGDYTEITFEQFKKYVLKEEIVVEEVIEPLPQFKVIESIETITKVENNEGNQFFIGDVVKSSNGTVQTIESFGYNKAKTNIIAFTNKQSRLGNGIGIDKIEHYIEPKVEVEESLLEKAKRLYPIGTKIYSALQPEMKYKSVVEGYKEADGVVYCLDKNGDSSCHLYHNNNWAKIIE